MNTADDAQTYFEITLPGSAEDLAETERRHAQLHQLIDAVLKFYNLFTARKGSATY